MSYPEPRYRGEAGEVSATYRPADHTPEVVYPNGNTVHYLATGEATHGLFGLYRWEFGTEPSGPDPHFHRTLTESFYILTGTVRIFDGMNWIDTAPGDFVHVPEGGIHGFRNESGAAEEDLADRCESFGIQAGNSDLCGEKRTAEVFVGIERSAEIESGILPRIGSI